jgi:hypothetical protein
VQFLAGQVDDAFNGVALNDPSADLLPDDTANTDADPDTDPAAA